MFQGRIVPHRPNVWLCGHLHAVLQGEGDGHSTQRGGISGHRSGHRDPVWPGDHVGSQCGTVYGGPSAGPAGWSGFTGGENKTFDCALLKVMYTAYETVFLTFMQMSFINKTLHSHHRKAFLCPVTKKKGHVCSCGYLQTNLGCTWIYISRQYCGGISLVHLGMNL